MTNNDIKSALFARLSSAALGYPIAWPGIDFTPPAVGHWLEVEFFPNEPLDQGLGYSSAEVPRGLFQISAASRPNDGVIGLGDVAQEIETLYPKGTTITGKARVVKHPYQMGSIKMDDRILIPVTIEYSG